MMTPFVENVLPKQNTFVKLHIRVGESNVITKVGYWAGSYWCYVTNPPMVTSFEQDKVIGWEDI